MFNHDNKAETTAINFDSDWRYIRLTNTSSYNNEFILSSYDDQDWTNIQLPHYDHKNLQKFTSTCVSYWYRKRFNLQQEFDSHQHIYLHFEYMSNDNKQNKDESNVKIPAVTIWLNEIEIFCNTLPEPISLTSYFKYDAENLLVIQSKQGYRLRLHARLILPPRFSGQISINEFQENDTKKEPEKILDYEADFDDSDGQIAFFIDTLTTYAKENEIAYEYDIDQNTDHEKEKLNNSKNDEIIEVNTIINGSIPRLAIVILIVGTRGDVQPFIALSKALLACGHRVRLATHETFRKFVRENGIEFYPLAGNPADLMSFMVKNAGIIPSVSSIVAGDIAKSRRVIAEILASTWKACIEDDDETGAPFIAEAIIANPPSYGHIHCAQKLQIPLHIVFTMPWSPTIQFPHPFVKVDYTRASIEKINMLSYGLVEVLTWSGMHDIINEFRKDTLGLTPLHTRQAVRIMMDEYVPHTYCWSPSLVPKPADWPAYINVCGFFFLDLATNYKPPDDIVHFLESGDPPIYIGFGSITGHDSKRLLEAVLEALRTTGYRALLSGFNIDSDKLPDNVLKIDSCPHDWLFQHVAAVCHHGGAGTTAAGLRAGKPTIIVPFFGDQFFWGSMISKSGAGPAPMPGKTVTAKQFAAAFKFVHDSQIQSAALKISTDFKNENGCEAAVRSFHAHLPLSKMRSDLEPSFGACFRLNEYDLQISHPVAQVLVAAGAIEESELSLHSVYGWSTLMHRDRVKVYTDAFKRVASKIADSLNPLKLSKSVSYTDKNTSRITQNNLRHEIINLKRPFKYNLSLYGEVKEKTEEEQNENLKLEKKVRHSVHYGLVTLLGEPAIYNGRPSIDAGRSSSAISFLQKNIAESGTQDENDQQINEKPPRSISTRRKSSSRSKDKNDNESPEQKAADMSGLSLDICKKILSDFKQIKHDRHHSNNNDKSSHRIKTPHGLHRSRRRSTTSH